MKKSAILFGLILIISILLPSLSAANPCRPIARACMAEGYYKGGNRVGKGLIENCVLPIVNHRMALPNASFSDRTMRQCKTMIMNKMGK